MAGVLQKDQIFRSGLDALRNLNRRPVALERRHGSFRLTRSIRLDKKTRPFSLAFLSTVHWTDALSAPQVGLEPTTLRLTAECSAIELLRNVREVL